ncbi:hypothetical protein DPMN_085193 [Dreissena polymorpha]|uniref:Uncharacterized protein n=1 Tax=Dreissena polymorpha TaxID=45954 RepID=A0A9D4BK08_DREPO|nr:hypothetical protein DPMN_085193 [Dreissena polymorpha]
MMPHLIWVCAVSLKEFIETIIQALAATVPVGVILPWKWCQCEPHWMQLVACLCSKQWCELPGPAKQMLDMCYLRNSPPLIYAMRLCPHGQLLSRH